MKSTANGLRNGQKQGGGTFLGIIIGLVVGLAIAVVVAMMITKTSTPFTNKLGLTKSDAPAVQVTDPNKPLYGSSAKEVMANANRPVDPTAAPALPPAAAAAAAQAVAVRPADPVKPDMRTDAKASKSTEVSSAETSSQAYYLQVGAFRDAADAESTRARLALIGVEARITANAETDNLYRVRIGPFDRLDTMNSMRSKLSENSIDVAVIKTPK